MHLELPIKNRISMQWNHALWLFILLLSAYLQASGQVPNWRYDQALIDNGHYWLLLSGNIVHLNWAHWGLNIAGLTIVAFFFSSYGSVFHWLFVILVSAVFVGVGLYWFNPDVSTYVGLSGVLHGLFIYGGLREIRVYPASGYALLFILIGKLIWEVVYGAVPGSEELTAGRVVTDAHLYGAIGGGLAAVLLSLFDQLVKVKNGQQDTEHD
ncbi:MAG: rhombosortase [Gammaproteobacteria bacterium]|nr:rhombosortase [Gammaproteobacteria bacterium]MCK5262328.1 rhombosortase [Gammaproteobacteria bacterium]